MLFPYDGHQIWFDCHGSGTPLILLHGNTASSSMFDPIIPLLADKYQVITLDFLGCGQSDHLPSWPADLWYEWAKQVNALCRYIGFEKVNLIGSSGGALAAINAALEYPQLIRAVAADSFAGITANPDMTKQIQAGRAAAKQDQGFRAYLQSVHGEDWEQVLDADTDAILRHSEEIGLLFPSSLDRYSSQTAADRQRGRRDVSPWALSAAFPDDLSGNSIGRIAYLSPWLPPGYAQQYSSIPEIV